MIYFQSDEKDFRRLKMAIIIAESLSGLFPEDAKTREFCSLEDNDQEMILIETGDSATSVPASTVRRQPINFPAPLAGGRPRRPIGIVNPFRHLSVNHGTRANPDGIGNSSEVNSNDESGIPKIPEQKTFDNDCRSNIKKKQLDEQCKVDEEVTDRKIEIVYKIKEILAKSN